MIKILLVVTGSILTGYANVFHTGHFLNVFHTLAKIVDTRPSEIVCH